MNGLDFNNLSAAALAVIAHLSFWFKFTFMAFANASATYERDLTSQTRPLWSTDGMHKVWQYGMLSEQEIPVQM